METLPSDSRQPPDGHEFPDYAELTSDDKYRESYEKCAKPNKWSDNRSSFEFSVPITSKSSLSKVSSVSNSDLSSINLRENFDCGDEVNLRRHSLEPLHGRSQSLIDMSTISKQKNDRWSALAEQRKKSFSKLKGLVIPEHVSENETPPPVNIPEIISRTTPSFVVETKIYANETTQCHSNEPVALPLTTPPWASNTSTFPKYSPAFKRKSLQVYSQKTYKEESAINTSPKPEKSATIKKPSEELKLDNLSDSPKSLESITSPTRSDCSFDYVTNSFNKPKYIKQETKYKETLNYVSKLHKDIGKSEDESDNDSAVSSSQSSYISRCSPPPSPTRSCEMLDYDSNIRSKDNNQCRLLKAASVEAINRKNILASAKCRSGRDLKVGSPVIQRKYEEEEAAENSKQSRAFEKRSISCEEPAKPVANGVKSEVPSLSLINKPPQKTNLVVLKPVVRETKLRTNFKTNILNNNKTMSVTDLRKSFEKFGTTPPPLPQNVSVAVTNKEPKVVKTETNAKLELPEKKTINGEVKLETAKPATVQIPQETNEDKQVKDSNRRKIVLCPEFVGGSIGITLAGGTDYETKEITVHKIRYGSIAYNDGQLKKGDKIISINGKSTSNLTHAESVELLKEPVARFVLDVEDGKEEALPSPQRKSFSSDTSETKSPGPAPTVTHVITLAKNGAGLGFSIEGGKDSPLGDLPLRVKKIFQGGLAEKNGELCVGDELLAINDISLVNMSRIETWSLMKKLPDGEVSIHIHR